MRAIAQVILLIDLRENLTNLADRLDKRVNASLLIGNKHFYTSDYQVHRRVNWTAAIQIKSTRTIPDDIAFIPNRYTRLLSNLSSIRLATNLTLTTSNVAWTTLASRLLSEEQITVGFLNSTVVTLNDGNYSFPYSSKVQWIHVGRSDIVYLLQTQQQYQSIGIDLRIQTGNYDTIGASHFNVTARMLTIWIDHGRGPFNLDYQYTILPNISLESLPNNMNNNKSTFSCQSLSFNLNIQLIHAAIYLFSETDFDFTLTVSQPIRINGMMNITIDRIGYGQRCAIFNNNTNVTVPLPTSFQFMGQSVNTNCNKHSHLQHQFFY